MIFCVPMCCLARWQNDSNSSTWLTLYVGTSRWHTRSRCMMRLTRTAASMTRHRLPPTPAPTTDISHRATSVTNSIADFLDPPVPVIEYVAPAPDATYTEPDPVIEHATLAPVDVCTAPVGFIEHVAPAPMVECITPSPAVSYPSFFPSFDEINEAITGVCEPAISDHC